MYLIDVDKIIRPMLIKIAKTGHADTIEEFVLYYVKQQSFYTEALGDCCEKIFRESVQAICVRTCIEEINECQNKCTQEESYKGEQEDILEKWCQQWKQKEHRQRLSAKYPVLSECIDEVIINIAIHLLLFLERFGQDKKQIEEQLLQKKIRKITKIEANLSDAHNGGTSVLKVELDSSEYLIYKPHALDNEKRFYQAAGMLGDKIDLDFYSPKMLCQDGYGWETYVEQKFCDTEGQVHRYYKRIGVFLFLAYLLKSSDLHMENLIAHGEYPVFVDMEALFTPLDGLDGKNINECITAFIQQSVMSTGILPFYHWNKENKGINVSALSHEEEQELPVRIPVVADKGTPDMHITYKCGKVYPAKNQVKLMEVKVIPEDYVQDVLDGFKQIYTVSLDCKEELQSYFAGFTDLYSRYLVADTQKYSMLISLSYHPDLLRDKKKREDLYDILWKFHIRKNEYADVIHRCERDYTEKSAMESVRETIDALSKQDMMQQCMVIETSMSFPKVLRGTECEIVQKTGKCAIEASEKEQLIKKGLEHILEQAIHTKDRTQLGWMSPQIVGRDVSRFMLRDGGMYLYDGLAGMFVLFCEAVYGMGYTEYEVVCKKLANQLLSYTDAVAIAADTSNQAADENASDCKNRIQCQSHNTGLLNGESSIVVTYLQAYQFTKDDTYLKMAQKHAEFVYHLLNKDENYDLLDGRAGAIVMFLEVYKLTHDNKYIAYACEAEDFLYQSAYITEDEMSWIHKQYKEALLGMAHGTAGMLLAYGELYDITREEKYLDRLEKILRYEHRRYNVQTGDWYDYRKPEDIRSVQAEAVAWCHGAGGILLSRIVLAKMPLPENIKRMVDCDISRAIKKVKESYMRNSFCLCHGVGGNLLILEKCVDYLKDSLMDRIEETAIDSSTDSMKKCITGEFLEDSRSSSRQQIDELEKMCRQIRQYVYEHVRKDAPELLREKYGMGLMTGYGGVIYSIMKK